MVTSANVACGHHAGNREIMRMVCPRAAALARTVDAVCVHGDRPGAVGHAQDVRRRSMTPDGCCAGSEDVHRLSVDLWRNRPILWTFPALLWRSLWDQKFVGFDLPKRLRGAFRTP